MTLPAVAFRKLLLLVALAIIFFHRLTNFQVARRCVHSTLLTQVRLIFAVHSKNTIQFVLISIEFKTTLQLYC